jgi:hypothetical protein
MLPHPGHEPTKSPNASSMTLWQNSCPRSTTDSPNASSMTLWEIWCDRRRVVARQAARRGGYAKGFTPSAMASMVSFDSLSSTEFDTQYVPAPCFHATMCSFVPLKNNL